MIRIAQLKLDPDTAEQTLKSNISKRLHIPVSAFSYEIHKKSLDCRKNHPVKYVYTVDVHLSDSEKEEKIVKAVKDKTVVLAKENNYTYTVSDTTPLRQRPVVVGAGPAGLFCAYLLAQNGYAPVVVERGEEVEHRSDTVQKFWNGSQKLDETSNVQFGEGGAGTFSDGKLNTLVKDKSGRQKFVLDTFVKCGAPQDIRYLAKPHIGTDYLKQVVKKIRQEIIQMGGTFLFRSQVTDIVTQMDGENLVLTGLVINGTEKIAASHAVFAIGHSARDTFQMLYERKVHMQQKAFAIGVRMEHKREFIDRMQYKDAYGKYAFPTAAYKLTYHAGNGRGVYTFCMCPGGYVVNASSEEGYVAVNGMSNYDRMADNSNTAIVATVGPEDFGSEHPLAGVQYQREWERKAWLEAQGEIPVQTFADFMADRKSEQLGTIRPCMKGGYRLANVRSCLPKDISSAIIEAVLSWDEKMPGYAAKEAILSGVETRTSSPVRILRGESFESNIKGIYPCGEGAGYAGGIMSAAMDGLKTAEAIMLRHAPVKQDIGKTGEKI